MRKFTSDDILDMVESFTDQEIAEDQDLVLKALDAEAKEAIGGALKILSQYETDFPDEIKSALDTLAKLATMKEAETEEEEEEEVKKEEEEEEEEEELEEKFGDLKKRLKILEEKKGTKKSLKGQDDEEEEAEEGLKKKDGEWSFTLRGGEED